MLVPVLVGDLQGNGRVVVEHGETQEFGRVRRKSWRPAALELNNFLAEASRAIPSWTDCCVVAPAFHEEQNGVVSRKCVN